MSASRLRVLMYHRIVDPARACWCDPATISATPADFAWQMRLLAARYRVIAADELLHVLAQRRPLPPRATLLTFDDGCRDFGEVAWPVLRKLKLPVTLFVPTAFPGGGQAAFWWDRLATAARETARPAITVRGLGTLRLDTPAKRHRSVRALQRWIKSLPHRDGMAVVEQACEEMGEERRDADILTWRELRALMADGVTIGAHSRTHPALTRLGAAEARAEIAGSRADLRRELGVAPALFSYPFGDVDRGVADLVAEAGFEAAVTCQSGMSDIAAIDPLLLRRMNVTRRTSRLAFAVRLTRAGAAIDRLRNRQVDEYFARLAPAPLPARPAAAVPARVAYVMSRFPKLSETFVLNEMRAVAANGTAVEVYPLLRERQAVVHPEVEEWVRRAHYEPFLSLRILAAHAHVLRRQPRAYVRTLREILRGTWGSPNFFVGALGIFPKTVRVAVDMQRSGVTHVHAHFATHPALAALVVHRLTGIPFSFTAHGSDLHVDRRMLGEKIRAAAFAVAVSQFNKEIMVREAGEASRRRIHVIHCGVDPDFFTPRPGRRAESSRAVRLVSVASFEAVKGHRFLIDACAGLRDAGLEFRLDLVGDGPLRREVEAHVAARDLQRHVRLLGGQPRGEVARALAGADIAVLASHPTAEGKREGIPVALMEAMAAGLPVVATAISGIPELVEPGVTGLLVPSGDAAALAGALRTLIADPDLRERLGRAGRARVVRDFNLATNALALQQLFTNREGRLEAAEAESLAASGAA